MSGFELILYAIGEFAALAPWKAGLIALGVFITLFLIWAVLFLHW